MRRRFFFGESWSTGTARASAEDARVAPLVVSVERASTRTFGGDRCEPHGGPGGGDDALHPRHVRIQLAGDRDRVARERQEVRLGRELAGHDAVPDAAEDVPGVAAELARRE